MNPTGLRVAAEAYPGPACRSKVLRQQKQGKGQRRVRVDPVSYSLGLPPLRVMLSQLTLDVVTGDLGERVEAQGKKK